MFRVQIVDERGGAWFSGRPFPNKTQAREYMRDERLAGRFVSAHVVETDDRGNVIGEPVYTRNRQDKPAHRAMLHSVFG